MCVWGVGVGSGEWKVKFGTRRMRNRLGSVMCKEGQGEGFGMETTLYWVMHRWPNAAGIQYRLLLFSGLGGGGGRT